MFWDSSTHFVRSEWRYGGIVRSEWRCCSICHSEWSGAEPYRKLSSWVERSGTLPQTVILSGAERNRRVFTRCFDSTSFRSTWRKSRKLRFAQHDAKVLTVLLSVVEGSILDSSTHFVRSEWRCGGIARSEWRYGGIVHSEWRCCSICHLEWSRAEPYRKLSSWVERSGTEGSLWDVSTPLRSAQHDGKQETSFRFAQHDRKQETSFQMTCYYIFYKKKQMFSHLLRLSKNLFYRKKNKLKSKFWFS